MKTEFTEFESEEKKVRHSFQGIVAFPACLYSIWCSCLDFRRGDLMVVLESKDSDISTVAGSTKDGGRLS